MIWQCPTLDICAFLQKLYTSCLAYTPPIVAQCFRDSDYDHTIHIQMRRMDRERVLYERELHDGDEDAVLRCAVSVQLSVNYSFSFN